MSWGRQPSALRQIMIVFKQKLEEESKNVSEIKMFAFNLIQD
jgi:hypothetical protein